MILKKRTLLFAGAVAVIVLVAASALAARLEAKSPEPKKPTTEKRQETKETSKSFEPRQATPTATTGQPAPAAVATSTAAAPITAISPTSPPPRGPGAVLTFDPANAPLVPEGVSLEDYAKSYYQLLLAGDYAGALKLLPNDERVKSVDDFKALLAGYEVDSYWALSAEETAQPPAVVILLYTQNSGGFYVTWTFQDTSRGRVLQDLTYARPGGGGCH